MKKFITSMLLVFCVAAVYAQQNYKVSTEKEKRGILIEEYTGAQCPNCPDGHKIASTIANGFRGQVQVVAIHTGGFAPTSGKLNYTTEDGDAIAAAFAPQGFPSGMVSRQKVNNSYVHGRDGWRNLVDKIKNDMAVANLYTEASYDNSSREMTIHVEGYNTEDNNSKDLRLNILITQDYIEGRQATHGGPIDYTHMHVLRDYITPTSGDAVSSKANGEYFTADYTYSLPADINGQVVKPENINILVFTTKDGMKDIDNVVAIKPEYKNMDIKAQAELNAPDIAIGQNYGYQFFEANVRNMSAETVTKATFDVKINDEVKEVTAECNIAPFSKGYVKVPCSYEIKEGKNISYALTIKRLNDTDIDAKTMEGSFACPYVIDNKIRILFKSDKHASENELTIKDMNGNVVKSFGPFEDGKGITVDKVVKMENPGTYCIELTDSFGDGLDFAKRGSLNITCNNELIEYIDEIPAYGTRVFFIIEDKLGIEGVTAEDNGDGKTYSISGMVIDAENNNERIVIRNGKKYIK